MTQNKGTYKAILLIILNDSKINNVSLVGCKTPSIRYSDFDVM